MRVSDSFYQISVRKGKSYYDRTGSEQEWIAARDARREIVKVTRNLPGIRKQYKTKAEADAALSTMNAGDDVRQWLEVVEYFALSF
jgi:hypothetical protein